MGRHSFPVLNQQFFVDEKYVFLRELGQGAYGVVCAARNTQTGEGVAIKKVTNVFNKTILTKRALREITCLFDMDIVNPHDYNEIYLYEELMEADLYAIIRSGQPLTDAHYQSFTYQILSGLKYIHSANVLHRDLKPGNLLVNADCELKICDFGLARGFSEDPAANSGFMTEYVATRWYRAPEIMLSFQSYTKAIDLWSVGCILAELLSGRTLFKGRDYVDQLNQILQTLGTPNDATLTRIGSPRAQEYIRNLPFMHKRPFQQLFPNANPLALDLIERLLTFDPAQRITVEESLEHPYLAVWHDPNDEPVCPEFDFSFETIDDPVQMKAKIAQEVSNFRANVRRHQLPQLNVATGAKSTTSSSLARIPDRDTILNSPTAVRGDPDSLVTGHYQPSGIVMSEDLERELSGRI
ncbi:9755_t:CDS:10 [Funneliformis geosporum]|nr:9755_t:CDS:10 [Funneliformis geosporum]